MARRILLLLAPALLVLVAAQAGCVLDGGADQAGIYPCTTDDECPLDGFRCGISGFCTNEVVGDDNPVCDSSETGIDQDGDGFGTGVNREDCRERCRAESGSNCELRLQPDCDDADPDVKPGADEACDGKVNNCEFVDGGAATEADVFACVTNEDCPDSLAGEAGATFPIGRCEGGQCVWSPLNQADCTVDGTLIQLTCTTGVQYTWVSDSGRTFEEVPEACR